MDQTITVTRAWSLQDAREWADDVRIGFGMLRTRLLEGYEARAWELLGYESWRECVVAEFGQTERALYYQLQAAEIERRVLKSFQNEPAAPVPAAQLRPLAKLTPIEQKPAWEEAVATAPNGKVTAAHVEAVVERRLNPNPPSAPAAAPEAAPAAPLPEDSESLDEADDAANEEYAALEEGPEDIPEPGSLAVHFSSASPEWYTPKDILDRVIAVLGAIDVDPCSNQGKPNVPASIHYTEEDDGLAWDWPGRVYMNPPYGRGIDPWVARLVEQFGVRICTEAIALVPARVDTDWFRRFEAFPWCAVDGRLKFSGHRNAAPFPSAIVYLGDNPDRFAEVFGDLGVIWRRWAS